MNESDLLNIISSVLDPVANGLADINSTVGSPLWTDIGLFWVGAVTVVVMIFSVLASFILIIFNLKTIKAANLQIEESKAARIQNKNLNLYPMRKELLETVQRARWEKVPELSVDISLLLPDCLSKYETYREIQGELSNWEYVKKALEDFVVQSGDISESDFPTDWIHCRDTTNEKVFSNAVNPFQGITGQVYDPETGEKKLYNWDKVDKRVSRYSKELHDAYDNLLLAIRGEIKESLGLTDGQ